MTPFDSAKDERWNAEVEELRKENRELREKVKELKFYDSSAGAEERMRARCAKIVESVGSDPNNYDKMAWDAAEIMLEKIRSGE